MATLPPLPDQLIAELDREVERSRRALEHVPPGRGDWKPHEKSMPFQYLTAMVATIPSWVAMEVDQPELDVAPKDGPKFQMPAMNTSAEYLAALEQAAGAARTSLRRTTEAHLLEPWRLLAGGEVVIELPRYVMIRETLLHLAHHRGQMTVYLRLMGAPVPALFGPSADDKRFD
jgi:uncharacterized damage-inducible protein DinB